MHLKRVELENFKSFGRKLTIPFLDGFTAITGPNGSGKSNIGDAVLFVLGPKSNKAIRAGRLTDLIFNGGKEKKPADRCQVSLVFDNRDRVIPVDADEVTLTRLVKLSKSNDENYYSYFYVNGRASSLTEFDTLLAKSRISADGYNIVRQGDVTRIVETTPVDRRRIVDEIAGITRFDGDIEKARAERSEVEANLERIRIVLDEISRQLATLSREREAALKWKAVKDDMERTKSRLLSRRKANLQSDLANVHRVIEQETAERAELLRQVAELDARAHDAAAQLARIDAELRARGGPETEELRVKIDAVKRVAVQATERANYARSQLVDLKRERVEQQAAIKRQEKEHAKLAKERDAAAGEKTDAESTLSTKEAALAAVRDRISQTQGRASDIQRDLAELKMRRDAAEVALHEARLALSRTEDRRERLVHQIAESGEAEETQRLTQKDAAWELKELGAGAAPDDPEELKQRHFTLKKEEARLASDLRDLESALGRLQREYATLRAQQDASEKVAQGYTRAVDAVLSARDQGQLRGICGTIAELADVDKKYALAMEVAAGGRMQAIVTETDEDAAAAIDHLKRNRLGRATFLPLNKMVPGRPAGKPLMAVRSEDAEGFAIDRIKFDEKFRPAFWYVFRDTVIARNLAGARKLMGGVRLVTLDGDLIDAGGAMTGGDRESAGGPRLKFGQNEVATLDDVRKKLQAAVAHQEALSADLGRVRDEVADVEARMRDATHATRARSERVAELTRRKEAADARLAALAGETSAMRAALAETQVDAATHAASIERLGADLARMEAERAERGRLLLASTSKELARELETLERDVGNLRERVRDLASTLTTREQQLALVAERLTEVRAELARNETETAREEAAVTEYGDLSKQKEEELAVLMALEAQQNEALRSLHAERERVRNEKAALDARVMKLTDQAHTKEDIVLQNKTRITALEQALEEIRVEAESLGVPLPTEVSESLDELKSRARSLEAQLAMLGDVNMLALDEYDRQATRKSELVAETARLEEQRSNLILLVDEIVARKKDGFFKVFDEINANFSSVFERLSAGGKAELILENPEDPFAGGLTMRAQPRGKKVTRLEALSGGEKGLTSMAFIFAIQEFDPSPFYYLDEVDMNLDGVNAELLARMVKGESKHAQFIIVSLRKVTLKEADHVYGVTMMGNGISEVVGEVRISEIADEPTPEVRAA